MIFGKELLQQAQCPEWMSLGQAFLQCLRDPAIQA